MISGSKEQLQQELEYTLLNADCHSCWTLEERYAIKLFKLEKMPCDAAVSTATTQRPRDRVPSGSMLALSDPRRPDSANLPTTFDDPFFDSTGMIYMHWVPTGQTFNKRYYVEVLKKFRRDSIGRGQHSSNRLSGISSRIMQQSTTLSLSQTIWPGWVSGHFFILPIVQTLLPMILLIP